VDEDEALRLAGSQLWSDRALAGRQLSVLLGSGPVDAAVRALLLDRGDSAVVDETAEALLGRGDAAALRLVAGAWHVAGPDTADYLSCSLFEMPGGASRDRERFRAVLSGLLADTDPDVRDGARDLLDRAAQPSLE
jgi:hypothetical protein